MYRQKIDAENNYAFIDSQNLNLSIRDLGWKLDFRRFRIYLREKYSVTKAFYLLDMYQAMINCIRLYSKLGISAYLNQQSYTKRNEKQKETAMQN